MKWLLFIGIWILSGALAYFVGGIAVGLYEAKKGYDVDEISYLVRIMVLRHVMDKVDCSQLPVRIWYGWLHPFVMWPVFLFGVLMKNEIKAMRMIDERQKTES